MSQPWWHQFFDDTYAEIGLEPKPADDAKRAATIDLILALLGVSPGDTVFDQCCGLGRLSIPLARRGLKVIGVDLAAAYVDRARATATAENLACEFHAGDAFAFVAPRPCDGAINWFTSFGYHTDDDVNRRMVDRAFESLRPGGRYAIELISAAHVLGDFRDAMVNRFATAAGELMLIQEPSIDFRTGMIGGRWTFIHPDGTRSERRVENRAYMPRELIAMLERSGFIDVDILGNDGKPYDRTSRRLVVVGRRP